MRCAFVSRTNSTIDFTHNAANGVYFACSCSRLSFASFIRTPTTAHQSSWLQPKLCFFFVTKKLIDKQTET